MEVGPGRSHAGTSVSQGAYNRESHKYREPDQARSFVLSNAAEELRCGLFQAWIPAKGGLQAWPANNFCRKLLNQTWTDRCTEHRLDYDEDRWPILIANTAPTSLYGTLKKFTPPKSGVYES